MSADTKATEVARRRWDRAAFFFDLLEVPFERPRFGKWRALAWSKVEGTHILEVGVGTGKSFRHYPEGVEITAIDLSDKMLARARDKAAKQNVKVHLRQMDVQNLQFDDNTFDTVASNCVFCSVPDPVRGLREVERVCKPGGKVVMLEHVLSANRILAFHMNLVNPLLARMMGPNINRRTVENVGKSGLVVEQVTDVGFGIFKLIEARKKADETQA